MQKILSKNDVLYVRGSNPKCKQWVAKSNTNDALVWNNNERSNEIQNIQKLFNKTNSNGLFLSKKLILFQWNIFYLKNISNTTFFIQLFKLFIANRKEY
jgi:hypothetical protein